MDQAFCDCDCLIGVLQDGDTLPDHICRYTMRQACADWWVSCRGNNGLGIHTIAPGYSEMEFEQLLAPPWPLRLDAESEVHMVVRQWAEEEADEIHSSKVAMTYAAMPGWEAAMNEVGILARRSRDLSPGRTSVPKIANAYEQIVRSILYSHGIPATAGVTRHAAALGLRDAGIDAPHFDPVRGALVTSIVVAYPQLSNSEGNKFARIVQHMTVGDDVTSDVHDRVRTTMKDHRRLLCKIPGLTFADGNLRQWNGQVNGEQETDHDIAAYLAGEISRREVQTRAIQRLRARIGTVSPPQKIVENKRINARIWRAQRRPAVGNPQMDRDKP